MRTELLVERVGASIDIVDLLLLNLELSELLIVVMVVGRLASLLAPLGWRTFSSGLGPTALAGLRGARGTRDHRLLGSVVDDAGRTSSLGFELALDLAQGHGGAALGVLCRC